MRTSEQTAKQPSTGTGLFALLATQRQAGGSGAPATRRIALCAALACLAAVLLAPSAASAKQARLFASTFGGATSTVPNPYPLSESSSIAVDQASHDVYVGDDGNHRVEKFDSAGHFLLMLGEEVNKGKVEAGTFTAAEENICAASEKCQPGVASSAPGGFAGFPLYLAVDNSGRPGQQGALYVSDDGAAPPHISKFDPEGHLVSTWGDGGTCPDAPDGQLSGACATGGPFHEFGGIATDPAGNLWVFSNSGVKHLVFEFRASGSFAPPTLEVTGEAGGISAASLAVDAEDNLYLGGSADKYSSAGALLGPVVEPGSLGRFGKATSVAVDQSSGELYVGSRRNDSGGFEPGESELFISRYDSSCHPFVDSKTGERHGCQPAESFGAGVLSSATGGPLLAVDPATASDPVYALITRAKGGTRPFEILTFSRQTVPDVVTTKPVDPTHTSATLTGTINPSGIELNAGLKGCRFEWIEAAQYEPAAANPYAAGHTEACDKTAVQIGSGSFPVEVHATITGLEAGKTYHYRLVASNPNDENEILHEPSFGSDLAFGPPLIEAASALSVTSTAATLQAQVNPNDLDTHARVEYVTQAQFEAGGFSAALSAPEVDLGSAGSSQSASFPLAGLAPATIYRYRVFAENVLGEAFGSDHAFTTQALGALALPDNRAWELVSPPDKHGAKLRAFEEVGVIQASTGGDAISYLATAPTESQPQGNAGQAQILSARGPAGWQSRDIAPLHESATGAAGGTGPEYRFFSPDLSHAVLQPLGPFSPQVSPEASEQTPFLRTDFPAGEPGAFCASSCYHPLVTAANVTPEGTQFGEASLCVPLGLSPTTCGPYFLGASPDAAHAVLLSAVPLLEGAPAGTKGSSPGSLYEWDASAPPSAQLQLISVRPGAGGDIPVSADPTLGSHANARNAISADGTRVVFSEELGNHHLYLRVTEIGHEETLQLDANHGGSGAGPVAPVFQTASTDGSRIFFTDGQRLTTGSGATERKPDLYECQIVEAEEGELKCELTDLTPEPSPGESAGVLGSVIGASEDGSSVYFVADGVLASNVVENGGTPEEATPGSCAAFGGASTPLGATCNLYLSRAGRITFVAGLSGADASDWQPKLVGMPARVSPDGRWLAFMSQRPLTGYDNRDRVTGGRDQEVYLYHAGAEAGEARLVCASCRPSGARPRGVAIVSHNLSFSGLVAANVPGWTQVSFQVGSLHQPRYLSDSGRLFFNSVDPLVPQDSNGTEDVYAYEPPQGPDSPPADTCTVSSPTYSPASAGCVDLISSGTGTAESVFLDASEFGGDVFFLTSSQLSRRDTDVVPDVYDARSGGGEAEAVKPVECEGDGCQQPAVPPNDSTPGSLTFNGAGNVTECPTGKLVQEGRCVKKEAKKKHHKKKGHKKQKRANSNRGGHK